MERADSGGGGGLAGLTPRQLCNVVYHVLMDGRDEKERAELDDTLLQPVDARKAEAERLFLADLNRAR